MGKLFQSVKIFNENGFSNTPTDLLVEDGVITKIQSKIPTGKHEVVDASNWYVSPGFIDCFSVTRAPGSESKDTIEGLVKSAVAGGYSDLLLISGGATPIDNSSTVEFLQNNFAKHSVNVHIAGTLSEKQEGEEITEMYDMFLSGSKVFTDGIKTLHNPELLKRALLYTKPFGAKIMAYSENKYVAGNGMVNEGETSAVLGMKARPALAEEIDLIRNIYIAEYTETPIHLTGISSRKSVKIIKEAKKRGVQITADVAISNLFFNDEVLHDFDTKYKLLPVIRSKQDQKALLEGVVEGTIDMVVSGHTPQNIEGKECEFDLAYFGGSTLEATAPALYQLLKNSPDKLYDLLVTKPAEFLGIKTPQIKEGENTNLTFFAIEDKTVLTKASFKGVSKTSPFDGEKLELKVKSVFQKGIYKEV